MNQDKKILLIEDEPDVAEYLKIVLQSNGYQVDTCRSAINGLDRVNQFGPDLICLDIMMPQETGMSFYVRLKKSERGVGVPVIVISGVIQEKDYDFRSFVTDRSIPPPEHYFEKPIEVDKFLDTVAKLIKKKSNGRP